MDSMRSDGYRQNCGVEYHNQTVSFVNFLNYRAVIISAIAESWRNPKMHQELVAHPKDTLYKYFGYRFPFDMYLSVDNNSAKYEPSVVNDWRAKIFCEVCLVLPPKPELDRHEDESEADYERRLYGEQVVALAEYNQHNLSFLRKRVPSPFDILHLLKTPEAREIILEIVHGAGGDSANAVQHKAAHSNLGSVA